MKGHVYLNGPKCRRRRQYLTSLTSDRVIFTTISCKVTADQHCRPTVMKVAVEFGGGAELLFGNKKKHEVEIPTSVRSMGQFLPWIRDNMLLERPELFMQGNSIRPGILVLINDADWCLFNQDDYEVKDGDVISFISTLHGG
nr:unnamed protein product [Spirometra erinaceieuropaei]